jgi:hypothetical protein
VKPLDTSSTTEVPTKTIDVPVQVPQTVEPPVVIKEPPVNITPPSKPADQQLADEIIAKLIANKPVMSSFEATTSMNIDAPELQEDVNVISRMKAHVALVASIRPSALNVEVVKSLVTPDSFFVYNKLEKKFIYGSVALSQSYLPISGTLDELFDILTGAMIPSDKEQWSATKKEDGNYELVNPNRRQIYTVNAAMEHVIHFDVKDAQNELVQSINFAEFDDFDGKTLPRSIILIQPLESRTVSMYHRRIATNPAELNLDFNVSRKNLKIIKVE